MEKKHNKLGLAFKIFLGLAIACLAVFFVLLLAFGGLTSKTADPDISGGIGDVIRYHLKGIGGLFIFKFNNASNVVYFSLSGLLYFLIIIAILYLIVGILFTVKKHKPIVFVGSAAALIAIFVFITMATGLPKYWAIINKRSPFENGGSIVIATYGILLCGALYILIANLLFFVTLFAALKSIKESKKSEAETGEKSPKEIEEEKVDEATSEETEETALFDEDEAVVFEEVDAATAAAESPSSFVETEPETKESVNNDELKSLLKEVVRDIVRDEIARNNANQVKNEPEKQPSSPLPGPTFGGPLVVQYFNGGFGSSNPQPVNQEPVKKVPEPVVEVEKPVPQEAVEEAPIPEEKPTEIVEEPVAEPVAPVEEPQEEKKPIIRIPFTTRMIEADREMQVNYNELKNEILSYGVNSRVSNSGDTFRLHRKTYIKITIAGLSLKLYFALNPEDYKDSTLPIQDAGHKGIYAEIPLVFKVKSGLSMRRCKQLIQDVFDKNGLEQGEIGNIDWVEELKNAPSDDSDED